MDNFECAMKPFDEMLERQVTMWRAMVMGLTKFQIINESLLFVSLLFVLI